MGQSGLKRQAVRQCVIGSGMIPFDGECRQELVFQRQGKSLDLGRDGTPHFLRADQAGLRRVDVTRPQTT